MLFELETEKWIFYRSMLNWLRNRDFFFLVPFHNRYNVSLLFTYWIIFQTWHEKKICIYILENYWALINNLSKPRWGERSIKLSKIQSILSIHSSTTFERSRKISPIPSPLLALTKRYRYSYPTLRYDANGVVLPLSILVSHTHTHIHTCHVRRLKNCVPAKLVEKFSTGDEIIVFARFVPIEIRFETRYPSW